MESRGLVFFIESDTPVRLAHLATMVMSGVLLDRPVIVIWMGAALAHLVSNGLDRGTGGGPPFPDHPGSPRGFDDSGTPEALLREARLLGSVTFLACSADAQRLGRDREAILTRLDDILAMTTILRRIEGAGTVLYL
ncbi:MAG: hypothetical protein SGI90_16265 [Candidatus Eisenbacteria bacterium]|nr:hypothetical protein [Candidatus Eisenbacteria bacterium]